MAQFVPGKKTITDFNDGEKYLNRIDIPQAQTINNLIEGLLFAQENGGGGGGGSSSSDSVLYVPQSLTDSQKRQARENISAGTSNFSGNYNDLLSKPDLSVYAKSADLSNYVTLNTYQDITESKYFEKGISVKSDVTVEGSGDDRSAQYKNDNITFVNPVDDCVLSFPFKSGTLALTSDIKWDNITDKPTIPTIPNISISNSGNGNSVTAITASGHTITVTKGATYAGTSTATSFANGLMSSTDKSHLDSMWNIWSTDGTTDTLVNKVEEVLSAFSSFKEGDTIIGLLANKADKKTLENYVTLNTYQKIEESKWFNNGIIVSNGITADDNADRSATLNSDNITFVNPVDDCVLSFPFKSGTLALTSDINNGDNKYPISIELISLQTLLQQSLAGYRQAIKVRFRLNSLYSNLPKSAQIVCAEWNRTGHQGRSSWRKRVIDKKSLSFALEKDGNYYMETIFTTGGERIKADRLKHTSTHATNEKPVMLFLRENKSKNYNDNWVRISNIINISLRVHKNTGVGTYNLT